MTDTRRMTEAEHQQAIRALNSFERRLNALTALAGDDATARDKFFVLADEARTELHQIFRVRNPGPSGRGGGAASGWLMFA